jgi:hypothetical protein
MASLLDRSPRPNQGGTITRNGVVHSYAPSAPQNTDPNRAGSGGTITRGGVTRAYAPTPGGPARPLQGGSGGTMRTASGLTRTVAPTMQPAMAPRTPSPAAMDFLQGGAAPTPTVSAYQPGAYGAQAAASYQPPQQTERANPLTGGNNIPMPTTSVPVRSPFSSRGAISPAGQDADAMDAAQDETIGGSMQGTFDRLRGGSPQARSLFSPRFRKPNTAQPSYLDRIFRATPEMQT